MALTVDVMEEFRWGRNLDRCISALAPYGGAAREFLPRLREVRRATAPKGRGKDLSALDKLIAAIESDRHSPTLQSVSDFVRFQAQFQAQPK